MPVLNEGRHPGEFLVSEAPGRLSREEVTIAEDEVLEPGTVLGQRTAGGQYVAFDPDASDGSQTAAAILIYRVNATGGAKRASVIARLAEVQASALIWPDSTAVEDGLASLAESFIIPR